MSVTSLGGYAIRNYDSIPNDNTIVLDLIDTCVSSLITPNEFKSSITIWKAKEIVKMKGLYILSKIPGALNIYWKVIKLTLIEIIPQFIPDMYVSYSSIWNQSIQKSPRGISLTDVENVMNVIYQLSDGGCEFSQVKSLAQLSDDKKKKKEKNIEMVSISEDEVSNALSKLECLCEVNFYSILCN